MGSVVFLINEISNGLCPCSIKKKVKKGSGSKTLPPNSNNSPSRTMDSPSMNRKLPTDPSEAIGTAVVKYNYQAQQADELSLTKGTRILILEKSNDGWWRGQSGNAAGWFPSNYTQEEGDTDDGIHTYAMAENVIDVVVALYSFSSNNDQELSFEKGDRLEILDRPPSDPEWYKARNAQGQIGLVPRNYLQVRFIFPPLHCLRYFHKWVKKEVDFELVLCCDDILLLQALFYRGLSFERYPQCMIGNNVHQCLYICVNFKIFICSSGSFAVNFF